MRAAVYLMILDRLANTAVSIAINTNVLARSRRTNLKCVQVGSPASIGEVRAIQGECSWLLLLLLLPCCGCCCFASIGCFASESNTAVRMHAVQSVFNIKARPSAPTKCNGNRHSRFATPSQTAYLTSLIHCELGAQQSSRGPDSGGYSRSRNHGNGP